MRAAISKLQQPAHISESFQSFFKVPMGSWLLDLGTEISRFSKLYVKIMKISS